MTSTIVAVAAICVLEACCPGLLAADVEASSPPTAATLAPGADGTADLQGLIEAQLASGARKVVIPPGRYRVAPRDHVHLRFHRLEDVEIVMTGVEMTCTETTRAVSISQCKNLRISGLAIDYDPLPFTQARITATGPMKEWMEFEILDGYPENKLEERIAIFDGATGELKVSGRYGDCRSFEKIGDRTYRVRRGPNSRHDSQAVSEAVGDILVTNNSFAPGGPIPHAVVCESSRDVSLEDMTVYAANCFCFKEQDCDRTTYLRCRLDRRAPEDDPVKRGWRRLRSANADAFHSTAATRGPQVISCHASHMDDDGVNIHGLYALVVSAEGTTIRLLSHLPKPDLRENEPLELVTYDGVRLPAVTLVGGPEPDGTSSPEIAAFIGRQRMQSGIKKTFSDPDRTVWKITVSEPVRLPLGSVVGPKNRRGSGFVVKDSVFGPNRSRGILIKASEGEISGNTCRDNHGTAIQVSPEWYWLESGNSDDLAISGNVISGCRQTAITIHALAGTGLPAPAGTLNRISVSNNTITTDRLPAIEVSSVKDGAIEGNVVQSTTSGEALRLENNERLEARGNTLDLLHSLRDEERHPNRQPR